jgi:hypothetical protein
MSKHDNTASKGQDGTTIKNKGESQQSDQKGAASVGTHDNGNRTVFKVSRKNAKCLSSPRTWRSSLPIILLKLQFPYIPVVLHL